MAFFFPKPKIPEKIPTTMSDVIEQLKKTHSKKECLEKAYEIMTKKFHGERFGTFFYFPELFYSVETLWNKEGFIHCTNVNFIFRILLIKSGWFKEEDIKHKTSFIFFISPHQYLKINIGNDEWVNVDLWGHSYGIKLGDYSHGFHSKT